MRRVWLKLADRAGAALRDAWRVLGSMSFAVAILFVVSVAASTGSLVEQNQPYAAYLSRYGALQADVVMLLSLNDVFHSSWFLSLLLFLALSTGICVWRNTPKMLREFLDFKTKWAFGQVRRVPGALLLPLGDLAATRQNILSVLRQASFQVRDESTDRDLAITAKRGSWRRIGYIFTHLAVVVICLGGLIDANPALQWQLHRGAVIASSMDTPLSDAGRDPRRVSESGAFRGAVQLAPSQRTQFSSVAVQDGYIARRLPYVLELKSFSIDYHPTGQPKDFISEVSAFDPESGSKVKDLRVSMNTPGIVGDLRLYQSGFDDGGTSFVAQVIENGGRRTAEITGRVGEAVPLLVGGQPSRLEPTKFRPKNVVPREEQSTLGLKEAFLSGPSKSKTVDLGASLAVTLRDSAGQAASQTSYLQPLAIDGRFYFVTGVESQEVATTWVRLPLDSEKSLQTYLAVIERISSPTARREIANRLAGEGRDSAVKQVISSVLDHAAEQFIFGGLSNVGADQGLAGHQDRRRALAELLTKAAVTTVRDVNPDASIEWAAVFASDSLLAYSAWVDAGKPQLVRVVKAEPRLATVLQVSAAPGAPVVYVGMAMLCIGVALMVLLKERRVWIRSDAQAGALVVAWSAPGASSQDALNHADGFGVVVKKLAEVGEPLRS